MPYKQNVVKYIQPSTTPPNNPMVGDVWWQTNGGRYCKYCSNGRWDCTAPLKGGDIGLVTGGFSGSTTSAISKILFPFNSGTAITCGYQNINAYGQQGFNSSQYGYICGGVSATAGSGFTTVQRQSFITLGNTSIVGSLAATKWVSAGVNSSLHGYCIQGATSTSPLLISTIDRITFSIDSIVNIVGNANGTKHYSSSSNCSQYGFIMGGNNNQGSSASISIIERLTFPSDTATVTIVGNLYNSRLAGSGVNSSLYSYTSGVFTIGTFNSSIERLQFPFTSGTAAISGTLSSSRNNTAAVNSDTAGFFIGGNNGGYISFIDRIYFPFDGSSSMVGYNALAGYMPITYDNTDFITQFV